MVNQSDKTKSRIGADHLNSNSENDLDARLDQYRLEDKNRKILEAKNKFYNASTSSIGLIQINWPEMSSGNKTREKELITYMFKNPGREIETREENRYGTKLGLEGLETYVVIPTKGYFKKTDDNWSPLILSEISLPLRMFNKESLEIGKGILPGLNIEVYSKEKIDEYIQSNSNKPSFDKRYQKLQNLK